jgi:cytochrome d ubiquinol oxidase subunit II
MALDLPLIWAAIIAFAVFMYVVLDGFDLGTGILFPLAPAATDRDVMMNSIAPVWDGNETWLVLGGAGLFVAFPAAYAILLPAFYLPIIVMLLALVFRGVAFEFRFKAERSRAVWDVAFAAGSTLAAFAQGVVLGGAIEGVAVQGRSFAGGTFDWATPFALLCGFGLVAGYALLGATWLVLKTEGALQARAIRAGRVALLLVALFVGLVSLWTPFVHPHVAERWFTWPNLVLLAPLPLATLLLFALVWRSLAGRPHGGPFLGALGIFALSYLGLGISLWPYAVPYAISFRAAAAADPSLAFMLVGVIVTMPLILAYTAHNYWVFRGKAGSTGYHP